MIKVIIVDDQEIVREGLKMILSLHEEIEIIGEACNGQDLLKVLEIKEPEVILMDIRMPVMDGVEATKLVKEKYPHIKIIILTTFNEDEYIFGVLKNGADGYILKDSASKEIIDSIKSACEGNVLLNPKVTLKVVQALNMMNKGKAFEIEENKVGNLLSRLTQREREVTEYIMQAKSNKAISEAML